MAVVVPFCAMRFGPDAGNPEKLVCPPYDIISEEERLGYLAENEHNIIRLELPREGEDPYLVAGQLQAKWLSDGILKIDKKPAVYVYEIEFKAGNETKKISGIICRVRLEEFSKGIVLPHEETLTKAKADRLNLMKATGSNFSQIYSLYNDTNLETADIIDRFVAVNAPKQIINGPDGLIHRLWIIDDENLTALITKQFASRKLYIADGHHRYETAINYRNYLYETKKAAPGDDCDYIMMMLVRMDHPGLVVFPTHRIVRGIEHFDVNSVFEKCGDDFDITPVFDAAEAQKALDEGYKSGKTVFAVVHGNNENKKFTLLTYKGTLVPEEILSGSRALRGLDVSILHSMVLEKAFGIDKANMASQKNLTYTRDFDEAVNSVGLDGVNCSIIINPTRVDEIRDVAAASEKMPQKSTYFYPKLITGMVMNKITK